MNNFKVDSVELAVADRGRSRVFYGDVIGLDESRRGDFGIVRLVEQIGAEPVDRSASGLYHLAILVPERRHLAEAVERINRAGWRIAGSADHGVSEAIYLSDPDGHGIEIYWDRPRDQWPMQNGELKMVTEPLDFDSFMAEFQGDAGRMPEGTTLGHVHLQVSDLEQSREFYMDRLGLDLMQRMFNAAFLSSGGYHHHVGLNTWHSRGRGPASEDFARLLSVRFAVSETDLEALGSEVVDPSGIRLQFAALASV